MTNKKHSERLERFIQEYSLDSNATASAIRAGYSKKTAYSSGQRLLKNVEVKRRIAELKKSVAKKIGVKREMIAEELMNIGFSNVTDFINKNFSIKDLIKLEREKTSAIESIIISQDQVGKKKTTTVKLKLRNELDALEKLAKHIGFYEEDNKQKAELFKAFMGVDTDKV